jgi:tetratricopeptide (TPR) repeat protein
LVIAIVAVYWPVVTADFLLWDDVYHLHDNPDLWPAESRDLSAFWRRPYWGMYVPVAYSYWGGLAIASERISSADPAELSPVLFHGANLLLHIVTSLLVARLLVQLGAAPWGAAVGAALFALHPLQVESVAWVSEARGLLAALFGVAAVVLFPALDDRPWSWTRYAASTLLFLAALLSKSSVAAVPLMILVLQISQSRCSWRRSILPLAPWVAACLLVALVTRAEQATLVALKPLSLGARLWVAADAVKFYLFKLFDPLPLLIDYGRTPERALSDSKLWVAPAALAIVTLVAAALPWRRTLLTGWALFVVALLPVSGLVPFSFQQISTVADRYVYLAMLGPAWIAARACSAPGRLGRLAGVAMLAVLAACGVASFRQARLWHDNVSLFTYTLHRNPASLTTCANLAVHYEHAGDDDTAAGFYRQAHNLSPSDLDVLTALGKIALRREDMAGVESWFRKAVEHAAEPNAELHFALAIALKSLGRRDEALAEFRRAYTLAPTNEAVQLEIDLLEAPPPPPAPPRPR